MSQVILISGAQKSGKDTLKDAVINIIDKRSGFQKFQPHKVTFAEEIYFIHDELRSHMKGHGLKSVHETKDRKLLQFLGTEFGRNTYGENVWVDIVRSKIDEINFNTHPSIPVHIISDCRFKNELHAFPDAIKIRLNCREEVRRARCQETFLGADHPSEIDLNDVSRDHFDFWFNTETDTPEHMAELVCYELQKRCL